MKESGMGYPFLKKGLKKHPSREKSVSLARIIWFTVLRKVIKIFQEKIGGG